MQNEILEVLRQHPGCRLREIGAFLHVYHLTLLADIVFLEKAGKIRSESKRDIGNMDFWLEYYVVEGDNNEN